MVITPNFLSYVLYRMQGGFGAGHLDYDRYIYLFNLPGILVSEMLVGSWLNSSWPDSVWMILIPSVINISCLTGFIYFRRNTPPIK